MQEELPGWLLLCGLAPFALPLQFNLVEEKFLKTMWFTPFKAWVPVFLYHLELAIEEQMHSAVASQKGPATKTKIFEYLMQGYPGSLLALLGPPGQMKDTPWELNLIRKRY